MEKEGSRVTRPRDSMVIAIIVEIKDIRNAADMSASYPARNEQANVHVESSQGGSIKFVMCAIDTRPVCLNSNYIVEVNQRRGTKGSR